MDFYEVVNSRRSVREFQQKPIEEDKLGRGAITQEEYEQKKKSLEKS